MVCSKTDGWYYRNKRFLTMVKRKQQERVMIDTHIFIDYEIL